HPGDPDLHAIAVAELHGQALQLQPDPVLAVGVDELRPMAGDHHSGVLHSGSSRWQARCAVHTSTVSYSRPMAGMVAQVTVTSPTSSPPAARMRRSSFAIRSSTIRSMGARSVGFSCR